MSDIDEIKARLNIVDIIGQRVTLKKAGRNFKALCPFHTEKSPSFIVSPDRQTFHCFGCGKGGSVFDFVMLYDHVDFGEALETLAERAGVMLERRSVDTPEAKRKQAILEVNHLAGEYYHYLLTKHPVGESARMYLKNRGVSDKSVETFSLGYSANDWDGLLRYLKKKGYDERVLEAAGLVIRGSRGYYDRFRGRVIFTLKDHRGNVVGFAGRVMDPAAKEAKYVNTSETPVYVKSKVLYGLDVTKAAIQKENEAIIMEGELDVISSFQAGISNAVAIKGSALTEEHARLLRRFTDRLIFALDSDFAGDAAARRGIDIAEKSGFDMRVAAMPVGKDPDEAARESPGLLKKAMKDAVPIYDYFIESATKRFDTKTPYGKKKISEEFLPVIARIDNPIIAGHYIRKLAVSLDLAEETVTEGLARYQAIRRMGREKPVQESPMPPTSRLEKAEQYLLALTVQGDTAALFPRLTAVFDIGSVRQPAIRKILLSLEQYLGVHTEFAISAFADSLPEELTFVLDQAYMLDISGFLDDDMRFDREWVKAIDEVKRLMLREQMESIARDLKNATGKSEQDLSGLQEQLKGVTELLRTLEKSS